MPIPVAVQSDARNCGRSLAGIAGSNPVGGMDVCLSVVTGLSLVQRSPTECDVSVCYLETSRMRRPIFVSGWCATRKENLKLHRSECCSTGKNAKFGIRKGTRKLISSTCSWEAEECRDIIARFADIFNVKRAGDIIHLSGFLFLQITASI